MARFQNGKKRVENSTEKQQEKEVESIEEVQTEMSNGQGERGRGSIGTEKEGAKELTIYDIMKWLKEERKIEREERMREKRERWKQSAETIEEY